VHEARTGACRLFGIPSLADFKVPEMEMCKRNITVTQDPGVVWISEWVDRLFVLNSQLHLFNQSPYFVRGFNLACWLDVYFDTAIEVEPFVSMRRILRNALDLSFVTGYVPRTGLREKLICIKEFDELLNTKPDQSMVDLLISIRDAYPLTGTYFYEEAQAFLDKLQSLNRMT
jgi:hypothetical protein